MFWCFFSTTRSRMLRLRLIAVLLTLAGATAVPAHAEAQFWEEIFRANRARRSAAPPPSARPVARVERPSRVATPRKSAPITAPTAAAPAIAAASVAGSNVAADSVATPDAVAPLVETRKKTETTTAAPKAAATKLTAGPPMFAIVSIEDQHISLYGPDGLVERSRISSGTSENPTPTGIFGVTQKNRWHESNLYSGAEMPYMQRLTWGGIALHEGKLPGYAASHGCIRLPGAFAEKLFGLTRSGFRVIIAPDEIAPKPIAHRMLPQPRYWPQQTVSANRVVRTAGLGRPDEAAALAMQPAPELDPIAYAAAERERAKSELKEADEAERSAQNAAEASNRRFKASQVALRAAEKRLLSAYDRLADSGLVGDEPLPSDITRNFPAAFSEYLEANAAAMAARIAEGTARADFALAMEARQGAEKRSDWLRKRMAEMARRSESVSILISRKDQRLYVRQALKTVFDVPVTIREPDEAIGNHAFVALPPLAGERSLRWQHVTMPVEDRPLKRVKGQSDGGIRAIRAETADGALDRVEMSGEVLDRLGELVWAGASIVITDHGRGHDGAPGHDFAVETRH